MVRALFRHAPGGGKARRRAPVRARRLSDVAILMAAGMLLTGAGTADAGTAGAGTAGAGTAGAGTAGAGTVPLAAAAGVQVLTVTGDTLELGVSGPGSVATLGAAEDMMITISARGQDLVIPPEALPYLGRGLSPTLFDVTALRRAEAGAGGRIPLRLRYRAGSGPVGAAGRPAIPGLTVTRAGAGGVSGFLTASSARVFGAALARQYAADHARGTYGTDGLFAGRLTISLAGAAPAGLFTTAGQARAAAGQGFALHTLTVDAVGRSGEPDTGNSVVLVMNADNPARYLNILPFFGGQAKFSVPTGHYFAIALMDEATTGPGGLLFKSGRLVVLPQFTVSGDMTVHMAVASASSRVSFVTPRPALFRNGDFAIARVPAHGVPTDIDLFLDTPRPSLWVSPTKVRPTAGTLQTFTQAVLARSDYSYNLAFPGPAGIVPAQHYVVSPRSLATVSERLYQDVPVRFGIWVTSAATVATVRAGMLSDDLSLVFGLPRVRTDYFTAGHGIYWRAFFQNTLFGAGQANAPRIYAPGQRLTENWGIFPLDPAPDVAGSLQEVPPTRFACRVCTLSSLVFPAFVPAGRSGNTLYLDLTPFSDGQPGHTGSGVGSSGAPGRGKRPLLGTTEITGGFRLDQDGHQIASQRYNSKNPTGLFQDLFGADDLFIDRGVRLRPGRSVLRLELNVSRRDTTPGFYKLSAASRTIWTWRTADPAPHARVPAGWACAFTPPTKNLTIRPVRQCAPQPLMTLGYLVHGMSLLGLTRPGPQAITITAGHVHPGPSPAITSAAAQVSFNGGKTFRPATVTPLGDGRFTITFTAPARARVTLRVTATDAADGSIQETIRGAYATAR